MEREQQETATLPASASLPEAHSSLYTARGNVEESMARAAMPPAMHCQDRWRYSDADDRARRTVRKSRVTSLLARLPDLSHLITSQAGGHRGPGMHSLRFREHPAAILADTVSALAKNARPQSRRRRVQRRIQRMERRADPEDLIPPHSQLPGPELQTKIVRKSPASGRRVSNLPDLTQMINPKGPGGNDTSAVEKFINVATSLPFVAVGVRALTSQGNEHSRQAKTFGASMAAMGTAATLYHASEGRLRSMLRKVDYYTISLSTMAMAHSLHPQQRRPLARRAAAFLALAVPLKPTLVTAAHCAAMEVEYVRRGRATPSSRRHHLRHTLAGLAGLGCFAAEDWAVGRGIHATHPLWHCLSCFALCSGNSLSAQQSTTQSEAICV